MDEVIRAVEAYARLTRRIRRLQQLAQPHREVLERYLASTAGGRIEAGTGALGVLHRPRRTRGGRRVWEPPPPCFAWSPSPRGEEKEAVMALKNPRHERFAQELAQGSSAIAAYVAAGYRKNRSASGRLRHNPRVQARVAELQRRAAVRTEVTIAGLTAQLMAIAAKAETSEQAGLLAVARACLMDAAKLNGLTSDKGAQGPTTLEALLVRMGRMP